MKNFYLVVVALLAMFAVSCSSEEANRLEIAKTLEHRASQDLMNDLYMGSDGDIESLARMLQVTPSTIERIRNGKTEPTVQFEDKIKSLASFYFQNGRKFSKLQSEFDYEYGWYDSVLNFPSQHPLMFWTTNILVLLSLAFLALVMIWPLLFELLLFFYAWIAMLICSPSAMVDIYVDTINPTVEQSIGTKKSVREQPTKTPSPAVEQVIESTEEVEEEEDWVLPF